jgi:hypothetical protein
MGLRGRRERPAAAEIKETKERRASPRIGILWFGNSFASVPSHDSLMAGTVEILTPVHLPLADGEDIVLVLSVVFV